MPIPTPQQFYAQQTVERSLAFCSAIPTNPLDGPDVQVWDWTVIVDGQEHTWQTRLSPAMLDAADAAYFDLHGFHDRYDPETAVEPADAVRAFSTLTEGRTLVTLSADASFVEAIYGVEGVTLWRRPIDVQSAAFVWLVLHGRPITIPWTIDDLVAYLDVDFPDRFTAAGQARWTRAVWNLITRP